MPKPFSKLSAKKQKELAGQDSSSSSPPSSSSSSSTSRENVLFRNLSEEQQYALVAEENYTDTSESSEDMSMHEVSHVSQSSDNIQMVVPVPEAEPSGHMPIVDEEVNLPPVSSNESDVESVDDPYLFSDDDLLSEEDESEEDEGLKELKAFCLTNLNDDPCNKLLNILRDKFHLANVPRNARQLYGDNIQPMPQPVEIDGGRYLHLGIKNNLKFVNVTNPNISHLTIDFSWDGVRLFKSSKTNLWPLVMSIRELPEVDVMLVGVFIGESKPKNPNEFFFCFNEEAMDIADNQFKVEVGFEKKQCTVHNGCMIADTPAKTWALG